MIDAFELQTLEVLELSKQIKEKLKEVDRYGGQKAVQLHCPSPRASEVIKEIRSMLLLDAFNKDQASLPLPLTNPPPLAACCSSLMLVHKK
ncbi:hypothetical protein RHMOL_Rhmol05G0223800 [Rhododendron molle]|uniref:Uncharacterized protein n=1 Tax=Rhododendron molle TaxID=49168 RepID=A0ACC0NS25_RHOML|nr:hypothetical protein RHMOL_Rhmol05G0223800 [Rhododendron molle]